MDFLSDISRQDNKTIVTKFFQALLVNINGEMKVGECVACDSYIGFY